MAFYLGEVNEGSAKVVTSTHKDENGDAAVPDSVAWTLTDGAGNAVGSGSVSSPAATNDILIAGTYNVIGTYDSIRYITISAVQDSDAGNNLAVTEEGYYRIKNLRGL